MFPNRIAVNRPPLPLPLHLSKHTLQLKAKVGRLALYMHLRYSGNEQALGGTGGACYRKKRKKKKKKPRQRQNRRYFGRHVCARSRCCKIGDNYKWRPSFEVDRCEFDPAIMSWSSITGWRERRVQPVTNNKCSPPQL